MAAAPTTAGVLACFFILLTVAAFLIGIRLWLRLTVQRRSLAVSDGLLITAWLASATHAACVVVFAVEGALKPEIDYTMVNWDTEISQIEYVTKILWASVIPFFTSLYFCKFALLATYMQLFPVFMTKLRMALYAAIAYCFSGWVVSIAVHLFLCWPIEGNWSFASNPEAVCPSSVIATEFYIAWSLHFSANVVIIAMPFFMLKGLQIKRKTLIAIYITFALGFVDIAFSLTRFLVIHLNAGSFKPLTMIQTWSILDENMALIIACLPSLGPFLKNGFKSSSAEGSYGYPNRSTKNISGTRRTRPGDGFEMIDTVYGNDRTTTIQASRRGNNSDEDAWSDGKKSNRSDIELVSTTAPQKDGRSNGLKNGEIKVQQEFRIT